MKKRPTSWQWAVKYAFTSACVETEMRRCSADLSERIKSNILGSFKCSPSPFICCFVIFKGFWKKLAYFFLFLKSFGYLNCFKKTVRHGRKCKGFRSIFVTEVGCPKCKKHNWYKKSQKHLAYINGGETLRWWEVLLCEMPLWCWT